MSDFNRSKKFNKKVFKRIKLTKDYLVRNSLKYLQEAFDLIEFFKEIEGEEKEKKKSDEK